MLTTTQHRSIFFSLALVLGLVTLSSCSFEKRLSDTTHVVPPPPKLPKQAQELITELSDPKSVPELITSIDPNQEIQDTPAYSKEASKALQSHIQLLRTLIHAELFQQGQTVLDKLSQQRLPKQHSVSLELLKAEMLAKQHKPEQAIRHIEKLKINNPITSITLKAYIWLITQHPIKAIETYIQGFNSNINDQQKRFLSNKIWNLLQTHALAISTKPYNNSSHLLTGWITLHEAVSEQNTMQYKLLAYADWKEEWPIHPATNYPPRQLLALEHLDTQATQIAFLLPFSGKLSKISNSIRDGFISAIYQEVSRHPTYSVPQLTFYDTEKNKNIKNLYRKAVRNGAEFIVGPLKKSSADKLNSIAQHDIPILALNFTSQLPVSNNFHIFSLKLEDEIYQLTQYIKKLRLEQGVVFHPESNTGYRSVSALQAYWGQNAFKHLEIGFFQNNDSIFKMVEETLLIKDSTDRKKSLENQIGKNVNLNLRSRNDIDFFVLLTDALATETIRLALEYHHVKPAAFFATSQIKQNAKALSNNLEKLNNIIFTQMPWTITPSQLKSSIDLHFENADKYSTFYAVGTDIFLIQDQLSYMQRFPDYQLAANTGNLSLKDQQIQRETLLVQYKYGKIVPIIDK